MKQLKLSAILTAVSILTVAAVGQSSSTVSGDVQMMDFEEDTNTLLGYPDTETGPGPLGWFKRVANTQHLPAVIPNTKFPPNPVAPTAVCVGQMKRWNNIVSKVPEGPGRANALLSVLVRMSQAECCATIARDESTNPAAILSIRPISCTDM